MTFAPSGQLVGGVDGSLTLESELEQLSTLRGFLLIIRQPLLMRSKGIARLSINTRVRMMSVASPPHI